ncbi:hypothetical protein RSOLAG1IB_12642 [Rhizoctonia solani AG-1 IB]|uniref:Uncharacterized protein n=1 Tax=Thanatephorus cucumeris (strain AG1-IB / isolate 7/3/14) TaxID=1108050 RepID=A0A0B7FYU2_THACB|nr:hypothetical protein RSOLAG1IB_12642 [Rhizoctonia solani AG-1 IB]
MRYLTEGGGSRSRESVGRHSVLRLRNGVPCARIVSILAFFAGYEPSKLCIKLPAGLTSRSYIIILPSCSPTITDSGTRYPDAASWGDLAFRIGVRATRPATLRMGDASPLRLGAIRTVAALGGPANAPRPPAGGPGLPHLYRVQNQRITHTNVPDRSIG